MEMRVLTRDEVEWLWAIDRRETHHHVYRVRAGRLVRVPNYFEIPGWHPRTVETETPKLYKLFDRGAVFLGAFDGDTIVGMAVVDSTRVGSRRDQVQLSHLYVSDQSRGLGFGTRLFEAALVVAREAEAKALYVSATPTEATVDFYLARGCILAPEPDPRLYAAEPDDIHLICPLGTATGAKETSS